MKKLLELYQRMVINAPRRTLLAMSILGVFFLFQSRHFFLDASSDSLMLENDPELVEFRKIHARYNTQDSLLAITFTPHDGEIFTEKGLARLRSLRDSLNSLSNIKSVVTLLDVPLFRNPPVPVARVTDNVKTLDDDNVDIELAKEELLASEAYRQQLISIDGKTALIALYVESNAELERVRDQRSALQLAIDRKEDIEKNRAAYEALTPQLRELQKEFNNAVDTMLRELRQLLVPYREYGDIYIGGELMVANDMLNFIRRDLKIFGVAIFLCVIAILSWFFRRKRWVLVAVVCCAYSTVMMTGMLGLFQWPVTVISSNFISLLLIMNMSLVIHLVVQYRELHDKDEHLSAADLLRETVARKWTPCLFTSLTTIAGFGSLVLCDIKPVKDFGMMMSLALVVSLIVSFVIFPAMLMLFSKAEPRQARVIGESVVKWSARVSEHHGKLIFWSTLLVIIFIVFGMSRLTVENSFVNHFRKSTDIYQGMVFIDKKLGGTTPLDITVALEHGSDAASTAATRTAEKNQGAAPTEAADEFDEFDEFDDTGSSAQYWYTPAKLAVVRQAHKIIERQPEVGKVWSLTTLLRVTDMLNGGEPLDAFDLAIMSEKLPDYARDLLVTPFVSIDDNQFRINARVYDSQPGMRRALFLERLTNELNTELALPPGSVVVNGTLVLYNSVLQSLFRSQILTLGVVFIVLFLMFMVLFRSWKLALLALFPNLVSALTVLGFLGAFNIPLDIMTITIASISIGIAVDDTIHYIHRFGEEFGKNGGCYLKAMHASHKGVGSAMFYTSVTIIAGYILLVFSNFVPSVLFGLLSCVAMAVALIGALTLLPALIITLKPFGPERAS